MGEGMLNTRWLEEKNGSQKLHYCFSQEYTLKSGAAPWPTGQYVILLSLSVFIDFNSTELPKWYMF
jgi:hypothetical protein